jgi:Tfp pilus assembly protein PilN
MGQFNLNLSTRPFKAHRAGNLGLMIVLIGLIAVSVFQAYTYRINSTLAGTIRPNQLQLKERSEQVTKDLTAVNSKMYSSNATSKLAQVQTLNDLIELKKFSWTKVFASLEQIMPENVYLMSMRPFRDEKGMVGLNIVLRSKTFTDGAEFVRTLENSTLFTDTKLASEELKAGVSGEVDFAMSTYYLPGQPTQKGAE